MKKRIMLGTVLAGLVMSAVLFGCAGEQTGDFSESLTAKETSDSTEKADVVEKSNEKKFVITSSATKNVTTFVVDTTSNRTTRSVMRGEDETVTRNYIYTNSGDLAEVRSSSSAAGTSVIKYIAESGRADNKMTKKTIYVNGTRGDTDFIEVEYIYDDDGSALGVIQRDSNGNIYEKGLME